MGGHIMTFVNALKLPFLFSLILPAAGCGSNSGSSTMTGSCTAKVLIAFYSDANCTTQVGMRTYDTKLDCFSWTAAGSSAQENSATRFQCYKDRLCYTQHPNSLTCGDGGVGRTDKQAKLNTCLKEPEGSLYSKLLSGTDSCPTAPAGFECPTSSSMQGTDGIVACTIGS
jgi:hypothetical protein